MRNTVRGMTKCSGTTHLYFLWIFIKWPIVSVVSTVVFFNCTEYLFLMCALTYNKLMRRGEKLWVSYGNLFSIHNSALKGSPKRWNHFNNCILSPSLPITQGLYPYFTYFHVWPICAMPLWAKHKNSNIHLPHSVSPLFLPLLHLPCKISNNNKAMCCRS